MLAVDWDVVAERYRAGESSVTLAASLGCCHSCVLKHLRKLGVDRRNCGEATRKYRCNHDMFSNIDSEAKAYWLGFLAADGSISEERQTVNLRLKYSDIGHVRAFAEFCGNYPVRHYAYPNKVPAIDCALVSMRSPKMCSDLSRYGVVPNKSSTLRWPTLPAAMMRHFLRGYFDGDGCISTLYHGRNHERFSLSLIGNEVFLGQCSEWVQMVTGFTGNKLSKIGVNNVVKCLWYTATRSVQALFREMYRDATVFLPRKQQKGSVMLRDDMRDMRRKRVA